MKKIRYLHLAAILSTAIACSSSGVFANQNTPKVDVLDLPGQSLECVGGQYMEVVGVVNPGGSIMFQAFNGKFYSAFYDVAQGLITTQASDEVVKSLYLGSFPVGAAVEAGVTSFEWQIPDGTERSGVFLHGTWNPESQAYDIEVAQDSITHADGVPDTFIPCR